MTVKATLGSMYLSSKRVDVVTFIEDCVVSIVYLLDCLENPR